MTSPTELRELWTAIARPPAGRMNGRRIDAAVPLWVAVDPEGAWHLLVGVSGDREPMPETHLRGLLVRTEEMCVAEEPAAVYVDLGCGETAYRDAFAALAADVTRAVIATPIASRDAVLATLARWRRFWSAPHAPLSEEEILGLFAELWFMDRWIGTPRGVHCWRGPTGARHDFQWPQASVEVKATRVRADGPATHRITSLEQLDDAEAGQLHLFSLQVAPDQLASNTLQAMVTRLQLELEPTPDEQLLFLERLGAAGYNPAQGERYNQPLRVVAEELYVVSEGFPRLTRGSFPAGPPVGVTGITYSVDLVACAPWRIATRPTDRGLEFLRGGGS